MALILVLDESESSLTTVAMWLTSARHTVVATTSAVQALGELRSGKIEVIVANIAAPELGGIETLRRARALSPRIPLIAINPSNDTFGLLPATPTFDASKELAHPFSPQQLLAFVERVLAPPTATPAPVQSGRNT